MIGLDVNDVALVEQKEVLERLLSTNPKTQKALQRLIRRVLKQARADVVKRIKFKHDPRGTKNAVRTIVYKKILGGNINILNPKKAHGATSYKPQRKLREGQRGGNRRKRSLDTYRIMQYDGLDREFILRFQDAGTQERNIKFTYNPRRKVDKWNTHPNTGNRSSISARHFFRQYGEAALIKAADVLSELIYNDLENMMTKKK